MEVIERGTTKGGIYMFIEDRSKEYSFKARHKNSTVAIFPDSKVTMLGTGTPNKGDSCRFSFDFENEEEAKKAFDDLVSGKTQPKDYIDKMHNPKRFAVCF